MDTRVPIYSLAKEAARLTTAFCTVPTFSTKVMDIGKNIDNKMMIDSTFANIFIPLCIETATLHFVSLQQLTYKSNNFSIKIEKRCCKFLTKLLLWTLQYLASSPRATTHRQQ
jgi:hypothetical protein